MLLRRFFLLWSALVLVVASPAAAPAADPWVVYEGKEGPGHGKHVVLISGDEEYRSEEALPLLGRILAKHHGCKCTVLFAVNPETGEIDPNRNDNIPGLEALETADLMIIFARFRNLPDEQMQHIADYLKTGKPVLGIRTATHAFKMGGDRKHGEWNNFGPNIVGEGWVSHHGGHGSQSTRGLIVPEQKDHAIVRGIKDGDIWGDTDVYTVRLPMRETATPLVLGQVLQGMQPTDAPVAGEKNDPMMPIAWLNKYSVDGATGTAFCSTLGAATDLAAAGSRRLLVNAVYYLLGRADQIPSEGTKVDIVGDFDPSPFGNNKFHKGRKPEFYSGLEAAPAPEASSFELKKGDHVCLIGGALADRMQHHGWLETLLHSRFPEHDLVVRNLGFAGDELTIRHRSESFGAPDQWLTMCKADVVFAFFGFNESFAGPGGVEKFKRDLTKFIQETQSQKYNGASPPRLVLFSPIAHEQLDDPNQSDPAANNANLALYAQAMAEVARAKGVLFIDLFSLSQPLYEKSSQPLTFNGLHLTEYGDQQLAPVIEQAIFPAGPQLKRDAAALQKLRTAVNDKNAEWHARYRTVDGYNVYGGRSRESYNSGPGGPKITNFQVMQEEMRQRDTLTENRDRRVWAVAKGGDLAIDDSNVPPVTSIGPNRENLPPYLGGEEAIGRMTLAKGCQVTLFASEERFPELVSPVQMAFDTKGRLWVAAWKNYPERTPTSTVGDSLLVFEDVDGDGRADKATPFLDDLNCPTGFQFYKDGVLVMQAPDLWFVRDTDGDGRGDWKERVLMGLDSADSHHTTNSMVLDPGGAVYLSDGVFHRTQVETAGGPVRSSDGCIFRYEPRTGKFARYVDYGFANPHGRVFDSWGNDILTDATGNDNYFGPAFSGYLPYPEKHSRMQTFWNRPSRPCPGTAILSSRHFPEEFQNNFLNCNVIGFQGIFRVKVSEDGSGLKGETVEDLIKSSDPNFRPVGVSAAPDGSLYVLDWHKALIGHLQHHIRDPNRDKEHGRIYRITYEGRPLLAPPKIDGEPVAALLDLLKSPEDDVRTRAKIELGKRDSAEVVAAAKRWADQLDKSDPAYEHHWAEALWVHQWHNVVDVELLQRQLASPDHRARAAATRVLCYWRDRVPNALELLKGLAGDPHARVRLEAVRAASFFTVPEAVEVAVISAEYPSDYYLDYTRKETLRALEPYWKAALAQGGNVEMTSEAGARYLLSGVDTQLLLRMERSRPVYFELLFRPGLQDAQRREALAGLAKLDRKPELQVLIDAIGVLDAKPEQADLTVVFDLLRLLTGRAARELSEARPQLEKLATTAKHAVVRQMGFVALIVVDRSVDQVWELGQRSPAALQDLLTATAYVPDASLRAALYPRIEPLLRDGVSASQAPGALGRYVRVELPGERRTLTLAEVEVFSGGQNIARRGQASQKNTGFGGDPRRGIDGNPNGAYGEGGQTHSVEDTSHPWWEVDLKEEQPIESIVVHNRTDTPFGARLNGFTLSVLSGDRQEVFRRDGVPAPATKVAIDVALADPYKALRRAAMNALVSVPGQETNTFRLLAGFVRDNQDRFAAIRALERIPPGFWPADEARPLLEAILGVIRPMPPQERTSPAAIDALEFADALTALLPVDIARQYRSELRGLGVRVVRLGTLLERMAYDKEVLAVEAGKPVEIVFENFDLMPHNFVIAQPGAMAEIGELAEATATQPGAQERHFVPRSNKILLSSILLQPRQLQKLSFTAPPQPGIYPYVCTYPGHWRRMYGALYVVEDLDGYLADPVGYLGSHPLEIKDELLRDRRPRTEWTPEDFATTLADLEAGRSFGNGKQLFAAASCSACHKLQGAGNEFGPDLTQLDPKLKPADILHDLLEPSLRINEKFQTVNLQTEAGQVLTGLVVKETPEAIQLVENPLLKVEPIEIKQSEIAARQLSPSSIMPKGLLDKLTRDEVLDLLAYVVAGGDEHHALFHRADGADPHAGHQH